MVSMSQHIFDQFLGSLFPGASDRFFISIHNFEYADDHREAVFLTDFFKQNYEVHIKSLIAKIVVSQTQRSAFYSNCAM